jgi:hypothetical protein
MKTNWIKLITIIILANNFLIIDAYNKEPKQVSFISGIGSTHYEAHRMAYNSARASGMIVNQQISKKNADGMWHVIIKVSSK